MSGSLTNRVKHSNHPVARAARWLYRGARTFTLPTPRLLTVPMRCCYLTVRAVYAGGMRMLICEPIFKSYCKAYGSRVRTGDWVHWITGHGDIVLGDDVLIDGQCSFRFAALFADRPTLVIGNETTVAHGCMFVVARRVEIGSNCLLAGNVWIFDSPGHPLDPAARLAHLPPRDEDVKPIRIGNNVWIGRGCSIFPGVTIGDGSVVSAGSVVTSDVAPYTVVAGYPARKIAALQRPEEAQTEPQPQPATSPSSAPVLVDPLPARSPA